MTYNSDFLLYGGGQKSILWEPNQKKCKLNSQNLLTYFYIGYSSLFKQNISIYINAGKTVLENT